MKREASDEEVFSDHCSSRGKPASKSYSAVNVMPSVLHICKTGGGGSVRIITTCSSHHTAFITNRDAASLTQSEEVP